MRLGELFIKEYSMSAIASNGALASLDPHESSSSSSSSSTLNPPKVERMTVEFGDGITEIYDLSSLHELPFFKSLEISNFAENTTQHLQLKQFTHALFKVIVALVCEKKPIHEAIGQKYFQTVTLFED